MNAQSTGGTDNIFLKIINKDIPSHAVYENEHVYAFLDTRPVHHGHTLVVPKKKYRNILDIPEGVWVEVAKAVRIIARAVKEAVRADGVNIIMNNESAAHQVVFHAHVHIVPRFADDTFRLTLPQGEYGEGEANAVAERITQLL